MRYANQLAPQIESLIKAVYASTPYILDMIPNPSKRMEAVQARSEAFAGS